MIFTQNSEMHGSCWTAMKSDWTELFFFLPFYILLKIQKTEARNVVKDLTAWVASEDISSGFIVQEDEEGVGEGTEPPTGPEGRRQTC